MTDTKSQKVVFENPLILLVDKKVSSIQSVLKFLEFSNRNKRPLVIVAEDVDGDAITNIILNKLKGTIQICCIKSPGFGDNRRNSMQDIAIATGAQYVSDDVGLDLDEVDETVLGTAGKIIITKDDTIILDGKGESGAVAERIDIITD